MKLTKVNELPKKALKKDVVSILEQFLNGKDDLAKIDFNDKEYVSASSCAGSFHKAIKRNRYGVAVRTINKEVYLIKIK